MDFTRRSPDGMMISAHRRPFDLLSRGKDIFNKESRRKQILTADWKNAHAAAFSYRHSLGMPFSYSGQRAELSRQLLSMLFKTSELKYPPESRRLEARAGRAVHLHADPRARIVRQRDGGVVDSSHVDPFSRDRRGHRRANTARSMAALKKSARYCDGDWLSRQRGPRS